MLKWFQRFERPRDVFGVPFPRVLELLRHDDGLLDVTFAKTADPNGPVIVIRNVNDEVANMLISSWEGSTPEQRRDLRLTG